MQVQEFITHISEKLFPNILGVLQKCKTAKAITNWRKALNLALSEVSVKGEKVEFEESKEGPSIS